MNRYARLSFVLFFPIALAYSLHGAKTGIAFLCLFLFAGASIWLTPAGVRGVPISLARPFLLFFAWCWLPLLFGAPLDAHLFFFSRFLLYFMFAGFVFVHADEATRNRFETLVIALALIEAALIAIGLARGLDPQSEGWLRNSLHSGLLFSAGTAVAMARRSRASWLCAALLVAALLLIRSRSGVLAVAAAAIFLYPRKTMWFGLIALALAGGLYFVQGNDLLVHLEIDRMGWQSTLGRLSIWRTALDAVTARPLSGFGLGNFEAAYFAHQHPSSEFLRYAKSTMFAHNGILQAAVETGLPGLILLIWGFAAVARHCAPVLLRERALSATVIVYAVTSLVGYSLFLPLNGLIFAAALAFLSAKRPAAGASVPVTERKPYIVAAFAALTLFLASYGAAEGLLNREQRLWASRVCPLRSDVWYELAMAEIRSGGDPLRYLQRALTWNNSDPFLWQRLALVLATKHPEREAEIDHAFDNARALAPFHAPFYLQEGFYRLARSQDAAAQLLFERAAQLEPAAPLPHQGLALVHGRRGENALEKMEWNAAWDLKKLQQQLENDPAYQKVYREMFSSNYGRYLFSVDLPS